MYRETTSNLGTALLANALKKVATTFASWHLVMTHERQTGRQRDRQAGTQVTKMAAIDGGGTCDAPGISALGPCWPAGPQDWGQCVWLW